MDEATPTGFCECGCGGRTKLIAETDRRRGRVKGRPNRFIAGHQTLSANAGYAALHAYLCRHNPKTGTCEECGKEGRTEYALIKGRTYSRNREDYRELCNHCHRLYDVVGTTQSAEAKAKMSAGRKRTWARQHSEGPIPWAKLTEDIVRECRRRAAAGEHINALGREFGVHPTTMLHAVRGKSWAHIEAAVPADARIAKGTRHEH